MVDAEIISGSGAVVAAMSTLLAAVRPYAAGSDTIRQILDTMPADHIAHKMASITCKCEACGAFQPLSQIQWSVDDVEPACERCDAVGRLVLEED